MTFARDCCDREASRWAAATAGHSGGGTRGVPLDALENRFGNVAAYRVRNRVAERQRLESG
ncbi:hypothetical protein [Burkholderia plantarii]|uniref:hypothetical protein n=1 Tax=Burkholderia plantarii TaxID=41899 RepID=UPI0005AF37DF